MLILKSIHPGCLKDWTPHIKFYRKKYDDFCIEVAGTSTIGMRYLRESGAVPQDKAKCLMVCAKNLGTLMFRCKVPLAAALAIRALEPAPQANQGASRGMSWHCCEGGCVYMRHATRAEY